MPRPRAAPAPSAASAAVADGRVGAPLPPPPLPLDVLHLIFSLLNGWHLSRCVSVCKAWRATLLSDDCERLWRAALAADFVDGHQARVLAQRGELAHPQHLYRFRRAPSALRRGALEHALRGIQAMQRERDLHVPYNLLAHAGDAFLVELAEALKAAPHTAQMTQAVVAAGSKGQVPLESPSARAALDRALAIEMDVVRARAARELDPRQWSEAAPRERVTWHHRLKPPPHDAPVVIGAALGRGRGEVMRRAWRADLAPALAALQSWWLTLTKPYALQWTPQSVEGGARVERRRRQQRAVILPQSLQRAEVPAASYLLYQALASSLLRGRCRCCNRVTADVHATLRVPMCATRQCAGAYPVRLESESEATPRRRHPAWRPRNAGKRKTLKQP